MTDKINFILNRDHEKYFHSPFLHKIRKEEMQENEEISEIAKNVLDETQAEAFRAIQSSQDIPSG